MPTREEFDRALAEQEADISDKMKRAARRARYLLKAGMINHLAADEMIVNANRPSTSDPAQFPHANRLK